MKIGTEEKKKKTKEKCKTSKNNTIKKQQLAREKERTEITKHIYLLAIMKNHK